jgi:RTX calcium-binding nonapeptide repeat (4 copies)
MKSWHSARVRQPVGIGRALRRAVPLAAGVALVAVAAAPAVTYPVKGGNGFAKGPEGWSGTSASCSPSLLCAESNAHSTSHGRPPGSLVSRLEVLANGGELFQGQATWRSPSFEATTVGGGSLHYDRQIDTAGIVTLGPVTTVTPVLVDDTTRGATALGSETLSASDSSFARHAVSVAKGTLTLGHRYHLELRSTTATSTAQAGITGSQSVRYDNVGLSLDNEGPGGASGSSGVEFNAAPLSDKAAEQVASQLNWSADAGKGPGGGELAQAKCTIVGTPGPDRIAGSKGNDVICGLGGKDVIKGRGGKDVIDAGAGADRVDGGGGADTIAALAGKDNVKGGPGRDRLGAGLKGDRIAGNGGPDRLSGGAGKDRISGGSGRDRALHARGDLLRGVERRG